MSNTKYLDSKEMFNKCNYVFIEKEIFNCKDLVDEFYKFLKKEQNTEPLEFIFVVDEIKKLEDNDALKKKNIEIYESFIKKNSKKN
jgi:hypothetical protein